MKTNPYIPELVVLPIKFLPNKFNRQEARNMERQYFTKLRSKYRLELVQRNNRGDNIEEISRDFYKDYNILNKG